MVSKQEAEAQTDENVAPSEAPFANRNPETGFASFRELEEGGGVAASATLPLSTILMLRDGLCGF